MERTVKDVVPALKTNGDGLRKVLDDLVKQYKTKQDDLEKWKVSISHEIVVMNPNANPYATEKEQRAGSPAISLMKQ